MKGVTHNLIETAILIFLASGAGIGPHPTCSLWSQEGEPLALTQTLRNEYETKFQTCTVRPEFSDSIENVITRSVSARRRYQTVALKTRVPWHVIAVIHNLECSGRFDCHLHNGDPLARRTVNVPAGRPVVGKAPFSWEDSAVDALTYDGFTSWTDWSVAGTLYKIESYNGLGYRRKGLPSPYLWSGSQHYTKGKYVADGKFDPNTVSSQAGAAVVLRRMAEQDLIRIGEKPCTCASASPLASPVWPSDDDSSLKRRAA